MELQNLGGKTTYSTPFLTNLIGKEYIFKATDSGAKELVESLKKNCSAPTTLNLKIGAQVVLLRNQGSQLVNGSRGVVVEFYKNELKRLDFTKQV